MNKSCSLYTIAEVSNQKKLYSKKKVKKSIVMFISKECQLKEDMSTEYQLNVN